MQCYKDGKFFACVGHGAKSEALVYGIVEDAADNVWVGTNQGLVRYNAGSVKTYTSKDGLAHDQIWALGSSPDGKIWIGTQGGLSCFHDGRFTNYKDPGSKSGNSTRAILVESDRSLLLGTDEQGLKRFSGGSFNTVMSQEIFAGNKVMTLCRDKEGGLLIGTYASGLMRMQASSITSYTDEDGLAQRSPQVVFESRNGDIWIGMNGGGLSLLKNGRFSTPYTVQNGLPDNTVNSLTEDAEGNLWIGTNRGVCQLKNGQLRVYTAKDGLKSELVRAMVVDREGALWIGTRGAGVLRLLNGKIIDFQGHSVDSSVVRALHEDRAGNIWIGGKEGLSVYKNGKFTTYGAADGMSNQYVYTFHEDANGTMWLGTYGGGLIRYKDGRFTNYTTRNGLAHDYILRILEDADGDFWMGTVRGIFRVSRIELEAFAEGRLKNLSPVVYGKEHGLISIECMGGAQPAGWKTKNGSFLFPLSRGLASFDPMILKREQHSLPPTHIEAIHAGQEGLEFLGQKKPIEFSPRSGQIEIQYGAINLHAPKRTRFRYRIVDLDPIWIEAGQRRVAYYTNLPPGRHRFEVIASNIDGIWSPAGDAYEFSIAPHFYQTNWFIAICLALGGFMIWGFYRFRLHQVQDRLTAVMEERTRIAREMHDTLVQSVIGANSLLAASTRLMEKSPQQAGVYLERAQSEFKKSLVEIWAEVSSLRGETVAWEIVVRDIGEMVLQLMEGTKIRLLTDVPETLPPLPRAVMANLAKIAREAVTNAIRHSSAQCIQIKVMQGPGWIEFQVLDDGVGFDVDAIPHDALHYGLIGMRERAAAIGGTLILESRPAAGASVRLRLDLASQYNGKKHPLSGWSAKWATLRLRRD